MLKTDLNGQNLHSNVSSPFRIVPIYIGIFQISFEGLKFAFECLKSGSNGQNLHSIASSPFRIIWIYIRKLRIPFEWI